MTKYYDKNNKEIRKDQIVMFHALQEKGKVVGEFVLLESGAQIKISNCPKQFEILTGPESYFNLKDEKRKN